MDIASVNGRDFLILVDQYSGWPEVIPFKKSILQLNASSTPLANFFVHGPGDPVRVWSDNGPQFNAMEFKNFVKDWGFSTGTLTPHYPQSNVLAKAVVKSMKKLIAGSRTAGSFNVDEFAKSLLVFRKAPRSGAASPSQMVLNRLVRDALPAHRRSFAPVWQQKTDVLEKRARRAKEVQMSITVKQLINFHLSLQAITSSFSTPFRNAGQPEPLLWKLVHIGTIC
jgi:hypothetical protein